MAQGTCSNCGVKDVVIKIGLCNACYTRERRHGSPNGGSTRRGQDPLRRFMSYVVVDEGECWTMPDRGLSRGGYIRIGLRLYDGTYIAHAHRAALILFGPTMPLDKPMALHRCPARRRDCANPAHLYWGDTEDNIRDAMEDGTYSPPPPPKKKSGIADPTLI